MAKVLIIGPEFYDYNLSIERAFKNLGFETKVLGYHGNMAASPKERLNYHLAFNKEKFFAKKKQQFNEHITAIHKSFSPDIVFIIHGGDIFEETIAGLKGSKKVLWMMDSISRTKEQYPITKVVDYNFFFEKTDIDVLWKQGKRESWFLPLALDEEVYFPTVKKGDIDILFIGALYENRIKLLEKVANEFKNKSIKVYGTYYSPLRRPGHHLFRTNKNVFMNKNIAPKEVNLLYNRSNICLNIHHSQSKYGVNQRFFEINGSKAFQLVDENPYISDYFPKEQVMTYKTEQQMLEKINYALENPAIANKMAEELYNTILSNHTFTHRIRFVLDTINSGKKMK
jgi:spore maturation protein CgeB